MRNDHKLASSLGDPSALLLANDPRAAGTGRRRSKYRARGDVLFAPMFRLVYYPYARRLVRVYRSRSMPRYIGIIFAGHLHHGRSRTINEPKELHARGAIRVADI